MQLKSFRQKDRYGNELAVEFFEVPPIMTPEYDHPGDPKGPDTVPAWLTPGEFVVNAEAVRMFEPEIEAMNDIGREVQAMQGGTIPEGGDIPNEPVYAEEGSFISGLSDLYQNAVDAMTLPSAPPGIVYRRLSDGSIGQFTERSGTGGGQTFLGRLEESVNSKQDRDTFDFSSLYKQGGGYIMPDFLSDEALAPVIEGMYATETSSGANVKTSKDGAIGPMQILPSTAANPGYGVTPRTIAQISDLEGSQEFAKEYLRGIHRHNPDFNLDETVTAYHSGAGNVRKAKDNVEDLGPQGQSYFSKVMSAISPISTAQAATNNNAVPEIDSPPIPKTTREGLTAEGDRKRVVGNAENVAEAYNNMETKRLANLEAGREEFDNINEKTYNGLKRDIEFQRNQVIEATQKSLDVNQVDPGLASAAMEATRKNVTELGVPTQDDIDAFNSPEYQAILGREGAKPPTVTEFQEREEKKQSKDNDPTTAPKGSGPSFANQLITQTQGAKSPTDTNEVTQAGENADPGLVDNVLGFLKGAFSDFFDDRELMRMAVMYTGSRVLGYDHQGSLNFAAKQYVQREEELHKGIKANKSAYTAKSYNDYLRSRDPDDLRMATKATDIGDNLFLPGSKALVPSYKRDGVTYVRGDFDGDGIVEERTAASVGAIKPIDNLHNQATVSKQFLETIKTKESSLNKQLGKDKSVGIASDAVATQASELYFKELARFARTPGQAQTIKTTMKRALERWGADLHAYKQNPEGKDDPTDAFEFYFLRERVIDRTSIPLARFGDTSPKNIATIMNTGAAIQVLDSEGNATLMNETQYKEYFDNLLKIYNYAKNNNKNMHGFDFDETNDQGYNGFGFFIHSLQMDPNNVNNAAVRLFNENKDAVLKRP
jgi:hypothetical protein